VVHAIDTISIFAGFLSWCAVWFFCIPTFRRNIPPPSSTIRQQHAVTRSVPRFQQKNSNLINSILLWST
jgi:hypothetical protein